MQAAEGGGAALVLADGTRHDLGAAPVTIGRLPECEIVLTDANASRRHVEVRHGHRRRRRLRRHRPG